VNYSASGVKKFHARGINPVTFEEQEFIQLWTSAAAVRFHPGDTFFIYVHPEKPHLVYWIDLSFSSPVELTADF
jgi:hypothetical protein